MRKLNWAAGCLIAGLLSVGMFGCAGTPLADRTLVLGEVIHVLSRQEMLSGDIPITWDNKGKEPATLPWLKQFLVDEDGFKDEDFEDGRVVLARSQFYWNNTASGIVRQYARTVVVPTELQVAEGNVIETEITAGKGYVKRVRYKDLEEGNCDYRNRGRGVVSDSLGWLGGTLSMVGPRGAASLYCPSLEKEGWVAHRHNLGEDWRKHP